MAWTTLVVAFLILALLATAVPLGVRSYVIGARIALPAVVSPVKGTPLIWEGGDDKALALTSIRQIEGPLRLKSDSTSIGMVAVGQEEQNEAILATAQLYPDGELWIDQVTEPRFARSPEPYRVVIEVLSGRVRVSVAQPAGRSLDVLVCTPHAQADMKAGSFSVQVGPDGTEVTARYGQVQVSAAGESVSVGRGERVTVVAGEYPSDPMPADRNLVANGNFTEPLEAYWETGTYQQVEGVMAGSVQVVTRGGRQGVRFSRSGEEGIHTETAISQVIDKNVQDYEVLSLRLDVLVVSQSLPGGGYLSSEFPLMVRLDYTDIYGREQFWVHGFYVTEPVDNWSIQNGERIPAMVWYPFESGNLVQGLQATRPAHVNSIRVYASGHNYESYAAEIGLIAR